ncbi:MAG: putative lipoprotein [Myxococcota bacterium]
MHRIILVSLLSLALAPVLGCSISASSETVSDSISSPFRWLASSSPSGGGDSAYRQDITDHTLVYARSGGSLDAYRQGLTRLATANGITNWEADALTTWRIGHGLQRAEYDEAEVEAFAEQLFGPDSRQLAPLRAGFRTIE